MQDEREKKMLRKTWIATLAAAVLYGLIIGDFVKGLLFTPTVLALGMGFVCGMVSLWCCRGVVDYKILFISGVSTALGFFIVVIMVYFHMHDEIEFRLLITILLQDAFLCIAAVAVAVGVPAGVAQVMSSGTDKLPPLGDIPVPDTVEFAQELAMAGKTGREIRILSVIVKGFGLIMGALLIFKIIHAGDEKFKSEPRAGECNFHGKAFIELPEENWFQALSGYQNNRRCVLAVFHRGEKKYDVRLKIFETNEYPGMSNVESLLKKKGVAAPTQEQRLHKYAEYVMQAERKKIELGEIVEYSGRGPAGYVISGESRRGIGKLEHTIFIIRPDAEKDDWYFFWFTVRAGAGERAHEEIESIINSFGIDETLNPDYSSGEIARAQNLLRCRLFPSVTYLQYAPNR